jgi:hypothetical protein
MAKTVDDTVQRIAEKGRAVLVARLGEAFEEAAATHADVLDLDEGQLEAMVERAAERADGLQWRRALAVAAAEELGIGLGEALAHPAVAEAQRLIGAPSYEDGLAAIAAGRAPERPEPPAGRQTSEGGAKANGAGAPATGHDAPAGGPDGEPVSIDIRIPARHVDGIAQLDGEPEVTLAFSEEGLEIIRGLSGARLVFYPWSELHGIQVRAGRRAVLRRRSVYPRVSVAAGGEEARFEVEGVDADWLEERLAPAVARLAPRA